MVARKSKSYTVPHTLDLAIDAGNGTTCVVSERGAPLVFASVIQRVEDVRLDGQGTQGFTIHIDHDGERKSWAIGDTANLLPGIKTRITTKERIGSDYQRVLILAATVRILNDIVNSNAPVIKSTINWLLNVPPVYYSLAAKLHDMAGTYEVEYNGVTYHLDCQVGHVYPEGAGAAACYMLDSTGRFVNPAFASGHTGVVDGGYRTVDSAIFEGPRLLTTSAHSLTNSISGVYQLLQTWAWEDFGEDWTEDECEITLRRGYAVLRTTKQHVNISSWITDLGARLADLIDGDIFQKRWNGLGDVDRVILAGGVAYMVETHLKDRYPNVIILRNEFPHTASVPYELMNAQGHIRLLQAERLAAS